MHGLPVLYTGRGPCPPESYRWLLPSEERGAEGRDIVRAVRSSVHGGCRLPDRENKTRPGRLLWKVITLIINLQAVYIVDRFGFFARTGVKPAGWRSHGKLGKFLARLLKFPGFPGEEIPKNRPYEHDCTQQEDLLLRGGDEGF